MKDEKFAKSVRISQLLHDDLRVHVAKKKVGVTVFVEKAIRNQIKKETTKS